jgi:hypothetical protein
VIHTVAMRIETDPVQFNIQTPQGTQQPAGFGIERHGGY